MITCYNVKKIRKINFLVTGLEELNKIYKDPKSRSEITFRDEILSQDLDGLISTTNSIIKIQTAKVFKQEKGEKTITEDLLIIYVDLSKVNNTIYDKMYKYILTKISDILKKEKKNEKTK